MSDALSHAYAVGFSLPWAIPFVGVLLTIALAPPLAPAFWHRHYGKCVALWALAFVAPDVALKGARPALMALIETALGEYLPFILLLGALFTVAGGLRVTGAPRGGPGVNTAMLALGTLMASVIGTTGAAMVMIRPMIRANRHRRQTAHVFVFFILLIANVGGALSPLGDPPLFLGYLAGVPFLWPLLNLWAPMAVVASGLLALFYGIDRYVHRRHGEGPPVIAEIEKLGIEGGINLLLLAAVVGTVLLRGAWHPEAAVTVFGVTWGAGEIVTDGLLLAIGAVSLLLTKRPVRDANEFTWQPMVEVAILFAAIFVTIIPVMAMIAAGPAGPASPLIARLFHADAPVNSAFFWATGLLSAVLDNAPTYLVFFGFAGGDPQHLAGAMAATLAAISAGAVFCGALTYVGNAPNLMVKALAESHGIRMPGFFGYIGWAALCLGPWLVLVDRIFFA